MPDAANPPSTLAEQAAQRRTLSLTLQVRCPDQLHWHAREHVPCTPPDDAHVEGWVCLARIEFEVSTREARQKNWQRRERARRRREHAEAREAHERARIAAAIHKAAQR